MDKMVRILIICVLTFITGFAQKEKPKKTKIELPAKQIIRDGNKFYKEADFAEAETQYSKALEINPNYEKAKYNLGNAKYQQGKFDEAIPDYDLVTKTTEDKFIKAENYHNIGNAMMKKKQYSEAVDAYKNALRNNPNDDETRYNLALAQSLMNNEADNKEDDKNNKDKNDKNEDEEKKKNQKNEDNKKNKDEGDQGDKDKDKKGDNKEDPNKDKQGDNDKQKQQPQPQKNKLSKQQIKQLLEAMNNEENKTQKKVNAKKARGKKIKQEKDW